MPLMLPVGMRIDACLLHKWRRRLLFISTKGLGVNAGCSGAIAGKPAPTGASVTTDIVNTPKTCGSWLASDGVSESSNQPGSICGNNCTPRYNASIPSSLSGSTPLISAIRSIR
ncbi:MAG: hypothetical protein C0439_08165 [Pseudomonas sp.]|nr:hypothetical protein [Pseudomonas sp.]